MSFPRPLILLPLIALVGGCVATSATPPEKDPDLLPVRCLDEPDLDVCPGRSVGYFYDYRDNSCKPFMYGNCRVKVPFATQEECIQVCGASR
ncbi:BPTI/Kunitz-type proteinase inhibitor domain-containing protein [Thiococcus pfennigii]|uniref:BPTI/Kunitz-type proteinase inhibitor domain-containing protein n=1 Tax=Thiococcus pfennigii TaxID=1057 RepID=UPI001906EF8D|nr:BPTI/Kunitz-type proteinase inhibitor domain-containing protein [Thiococcus pfennigii]MBK1701397.1 hypothetical protein [Thiococcus pfennigii]